MVTYRILVNETSDMKITEVNIFNNDELENIDFEILLNSISNGRLDDEYEIKSFVDGCDEYVPYYSKNTAEAEFESYLLLPGAYKINEYTIQLFN